MHWLAVNIASGMTCLSNEQEMNIADYIYVPLHIYMIPSNLFSTSETETFFFRFSNYPLGNPTSK